MHNRITGIILCLALLAIALTGACAHTVTQPPFTPIFEIFSITSENTPSIPAGEILTISLKNISSISVTSLTATLGIGTKGFPFVYNFAVSVSRPLLPGQTIDSAAIATMGAPYINGQYYPLTLSGTTQTGVSFGYTQYVQVNPVPTPAGSYFENSPMYFDASQTIVVRAGDEFGVCYFQPDDYFIRFTEEHDSSALSLIDKEIIIFNERPIPVDEVQWYFFKATGSGNTKITINMFEHLAPTPIQKVYNVTIN